MEVIKYPDRKDWSDLLLRPAFDTSSLDELVQGVLNAVKTHGDRAVLDYTSKFDQVKLDRLTVNSEEIQQAIRLVDDDLKDAIDQAIQNITAFHKAQQSGEIRQEVQDGVTCWQKPIAIEKVGLYIPGGTAPLFSTVLMLGIPANIAGCKEIVLCTPPGKDGTINPAILFAAHRIGVTKIFKAGGVQAIGAMAYGTESIPKVFKIFGPGNQYVTAAKQLVARDAAAIDMPAGPSEVAVLADETSNPAFLASDLLSQAEHGADSQVILITTSESIIARVEEEIGKQLEELPRKDLAEESLKHSRIFLVRNEAEMMDLVNEYAAEHLIISTKNADQLAGQVVNAGSVFIGEYTPESAGDYASGTNHTLPTHGWATAFSGVNLDSYIRKVTFQKITKEGLVQIGPAIEKMAEAEELMAHKNAVSIRLNN